MGNKPSAFAADRSDSSVQPTDRRALQRLHAKLRRTPHVLENTLQLDASHGRLDSLVIKFKFNAPTPCRITTFTMATENEKTGQIITASSTIPGHPVISKEGADQQFPGNPDAAHVILVSSITPTFLNHKSGTFPLVIRIESLSKGYAAAAYDIRTAPIGTRLTHAINAHTLLCKLAFKPDGGWEVAVLKRRLWLNGTCHPLPTTRVLNAATMNESLTRLMGGTPWRPSVRYPKLNLLTPPPTTSPAPGPTKPKFISKQLPRGSSAAAATTAATPSPMCCLCGSRPLSVVVLPCRHSNMCLECAVRQRVHHNRCPTCWQSIDTLVPINMAALRAGPTAA